MQVRDLIKKQSPDNQIIYVNKEQYAFLEKIHILVFYNLQDLVATFQNYFTFGGLPYLINLNAEAQVAYEYLANIYNTILLKDVVTRFKVRNVKFLENLIVF